MGGPHPSSLRDHVTHSARKIVVLHIQLQFDPRRRIAGLGQRFVILNMCSP